MPAVPSAALTTARQRQLKIFISYSHETEIAGHKERVKALADKLTDENFEVVLDQQTDREPGEGFDEWQEAAIDTANHIIVILSPKYGKRGSGSKLELTSIKRRNDYLPQQWRITQAYFDPLYDEPARQIKVRIHLLGTYVLGLTNVNLDQNENWLPLLKRIRNSADETLPDKTEPAAPATIVVPKTPEVIVNKNATANDRGQDSNAFESGVGIIIIGDVVDFSSKKLKPLERQIVLVEMWKFLQSHPPLKDWACRKDSTLDGAIVVFDGHGHQRHQSIKVAALQFAVEWIRHMHEEILINGKQRPVHFRIGIEFGDYAHFTLPGGDKNDHEKIIGSGPNDCDRIVGLGDDGDILLSEKFFEIWEADTEEDVKCVIVPSAHPLEVFPKPGHRQKVRIYNGHRARGWSQMPLALRKIQAATGHIGEILKEIVKTYRFWLEDEVAGWIADHAGDHTEREDEFREAINWKKAKIRVSIFSPAPDETDSLACTRFRYIDGNGSSLRQSLLPKGKTRYFIGDAARAQGTPGKAFVTGKPQVVSGLPDWKADPEGYIEKFSKRKLCLDREEIIDFARHARTFISFVVVLPDLPHEAIVCVDSLNDGGFFDEATYRALARDLQRSYSPLLALLLQARG